jgi:hypothetical protein
VEVKTFALLLAKSLEEIFADRHLVEICVVRQKTFFVFAHASDEFRTHNDVARVVNFMASTICVRQTFSDASVDRTNRVGHLHPASR